MKQGRSSETEVAEILVKLPTLIWEFDSSSPLHWGRKRKRSAINLPHKPDPSSSPATPFSFSFSPSDSDHTLFTPNLSLNTKKEHYLKIIQQLTEHNNLLSREMKNVRCYFDKLKDFNLKLKSRKQELSRGPNEAHHLVRKEAQLHFPGMVHHTPLMVNRTAWAPELGDGGAREACGQATTSLGVASLSGGGLGLSIANSNNDVGPIGIPDLNVPLEESMGVEEWCEALDVSATVANSRAVAAQARQNRLHIYRLKNPIANTKTRYSFR